jgi:hypothetical protein
MVRVGVAELAGRTLRRWDNRACVPINISGRTTRRRTPNEGVLLREGKGEGMGERAKSHPSQPADAISFGRPRRHRAAVTAYVSFRPLVLRTCPLVAHAPVLPAHTGTCTHRPHRCLRVAQRLNTPWSLSLKLRSIPVWPSILQSPPHPPLHSSSRAAARAPPSVRASMIPSRPRVARFPRSFPLSSAYSARTPPPALQAHAERDRQRRVNAVTRSRRNHY